MAANGFVIDAPSGSNVNPMAVSGAGDFNGDGLGDLIIGIPESEDLVDGVATAIPGGAYVVFGNSLGFPSPLDLGSLDGSNGFEIQGEDAIEQAGFDVSAAGDVNNDGFDDVIVGGNFGNGFAGRAYVVLGRGTTITSGTGSIDELLDLGPGDQVIYTVSATIAASATVETVVNATSTVATGLTDTDPANNTASATTTISSGTAPAVQSIQINSGEDSRSQITSITVTFDTIVDHGPLATAFEITQIETTTEVTSVIVTPSDSSGVTVATLTFGSGPSVETRNESVGGAQGNSLADGNYLLEIIASQVQSSGIPMASNVDFGGQNASVPEADNDDFFRLFGDANGDGVRNGIDLNAIIPTLFNAANYRADLDSQGDGVINGIDLNALIPTLFGAPRP